MRLSGEWLKMTGVRRYKFILCLLLLVTGLFLVSCSSDSGSEEPAGGTTQTETAANTQNAQKNETESGADAESKESGADGKSKESEAGGDGQEAGSYEAPAFQDVDFSEKKAEGNDSVQIDLSHVASGYVSLICSETIKTKIQILKDEETYNYDVTPNEEMIYPLQCGNGHYTIRVMRNVKDKKYVEIYKCEADVKLKDEFQPFIRTNQFADYSKDSACVKKAAEFAAQATGTNDYITKVFDYITKNITYDYEKAETVQAGYLPDPDSTLAENKGICMDYAALAAAMLRSQGIPTKVVLGYVSPSECYHAWNMYYTEEDGWVAVEYETEKNSWNRIDTTFAANGENSTYIGDGSNYDDVYQY